MRSLSVAMLATTAFLLPSIASAQTVDEAGAALLEAQVAGLVDQWFLTQPGSSYLWDGDLSAMVSGDSYLLSIPPLRFEIQNDVPNDVPDVVGELPAFDATVTPLSNGWQQAEWDYPGPVVFFNPSDEDERVTVRFTSQNNNLVIAPEYRLAMGADFVVNDITATITDVPVPLEIEQISITSDSSEHDTAPHTYDSSSSMMLSNLRFDAGEEGQVTLESLTLSGESERQRLDLLAEAEERMRGLEPESDAYWSAFIDVLRENAGEKWIGDVSFGMALREFSMVIPDVTGSIEALNVAMSAEGLDQELAKLALELEVVDFSSADVPPEFARVTPTHATLDIEAVDTPIDAISRELYGVLGDAPSDEELFGPKGRRAGVGNPAMNWQNFDPMVFFDIVMNSETQLLIETLFVEAPIGYIAAEGTINPNPQAALQVVASVDLNIAGLPEMIAFAQNAGGDAAQAAGLASALSAMGRDGVDEDGVAIKEFDLELTAAGQVLLNGNDMSAMMGMFQ